VVWLKIQEPVTQVLNVSSAVRVNWK